jgi:hypothetical protein
MSSRSGEAVSQPRGIGVQRRRLVALSKVSQPCSNSPESISPRLGRVLHTRHFTPLESTNSRTAIATVYPASTVPPGYRDRVTWPPNVEAAGFSSNHYRFWSAESELCRVAR